MSAEAQTLLLYMQKRKALLLIKQREPKLYPRREATLLSIVYCEKRGITMLLQDSVKTTSIAFFKGKLTEKETVRGY